MSIESEVYCPVCGDVVINNESEDGTLTWQCKSCDWIGLRYKPSVGYFKEKCEYCEVDVDDRKIVFVIPTDYYDINIYVDGNGKLTEDFYNTKINYCPMCGREL